MTEPEQKAIITLALMAAFADGGNSEVERAEVKRIADSLSKNADINVATIYQDVILNRVSLVSVVAALTTQETKSLAFELCAYATRTERKARPNAHSLPTCVRHLPSIQWLTPPRMTLPLVQQASPPHRYRVRRHSNHR